MRQSIFLLFFSFVFTSCATKMVMCPRELEGQETIYSNGMESILSNQENSSVVLSPSSEIFSSMERPSFIFSIVNRSEENIEVSEEDVFASVLDEKIHVFTYEELLAEEKRRQAIDAVCVLISGASGIASASMAGRTHTYGSYSGYSKHGYECGNFSATSYSSANSSRAFDAANTKTLLLASEARQRHESVVGDLSQNYLKKNTLLPGQVISGRVEISYLLPPNEPQDLIVSLDVGPDHHEFSLEYDRLKRK